MASCEQHYQYIPFYIDAVVCETGWVQEVEGI